MAKYPDLKSFVNVNYIDVLSSEIQKFVDKNLDGNGFHSINVVSLMQHRVENVAVKTIRCQEAGLQKIKMKIGVAADIVDLTLGTKKTEASRKTRWFYVTVEANIDEKLKDPIPLYTEEFYSGHFEKESALDQFLLPYVYTAELENMADDFTLFYCTDAIYDGYKFPAEYVLRELGIDCHSADLPDNCFGRMYFKEGKASIYSSYPMIGEVNDSDAKIKPGTILLNRNRFYLGNDGTFRLTIAHELIHWYLHKKYFKLLSILDDDAEVLSCEVEPNQLDDSMTPAQKAHWFAEWQANALAIRIAMPQELTVKAFYEAREAASPYVYTGEFVEDIISRVAVLFDVPRFVVKQRARQLDWDLVDGAFVHVDGRYHDAFSFQEGILDQHQTFILDQKGYEKLYHNSREFADLIDSGKYIYLGYVVCKNDPKYVVADVTFRFAELKLSDYAREHAEECCLIFNWRSTSYLKDEYEFYGQAYLSKEVSAEPYVEYTYDKDFNDKYHQTPAQIAEAVAAYNAAMDKAKKVQIEMMSQGCFDFASSLIYHMDRKNITVEQLSERADLSVTTIKKYRSGEIANPPVENVMAVCIGLNLPKEYSKHLLKSASYELNENKPVDRAYLFCLDYSDGTIHQWNMILNAFHVNRIPYTRNQKKSE